ncbi:DUF3379 domain-containing protein [Vibrio aestuarianus]|uniref:DUF3379 domain-containing protein n=1 Tax=Vibrio aestuarianus TaxID=28171 RepID=UPI00237CD70E|nr:DUF3379 domain-containing protein [Vibrio aestuarianus]MDE1338849.1 DUF3379 domain-containing protein [Vibrio aestuarianus]
MDDLEFRRRVMSDPKQRDKDLIDAASANEANSKFLDDVLNLDTKIAAAMNVDVPDDLADRILFNQTSVADNVVRATFAKQAMAMAASIAFVFGLLVGQVNWGNLIVPPAQASLVDTAIKHVIDEDGFVSTLDEQVNSSQINAKMLPFAYQLNHNFPYHVYYLNHCGFGQANALHMVFQGEKGKVTLFLAGVASEQPANFTQQGMNGIVEPVGNTSLILVGEKGEDVANIAKKLMPMLKPAS